MHKIKKYKNYEYYIDENNCVHITKLVTQYGRPLHDRGNVKIPATIDDCPVTSIESKAFADVAFWADKLTIPESVTHIADGAFDCDAKVSAPVHLEERLKEIITSKDVFFAHSQGADGVVREVSTHDTIERYDFYGGIACTYMGSEKDVVIPKGLDDIGPGLFEDNTSIFSVDCSNGVYHIGEEAFKGCINLKKVVLGRKINRIDDRAFYGCENLETVVFPNKQVQMGKDVFGGCPSLSLPENKKATPIISRKIVVIYTNGKREEFDSVSERFRGDDTVSYVEVNGCHDITYDAFSGCSNLECVVIKGKVRLFSFAFSECPKLKTVVFHEEPSFHDYVHHNFDAEESIFAGCRRLSKVEFKYSGGYKPSLGRLLSKRNINVDRWRRELSEENARARSNLNYWNGWHL